MHQGKIHRMRLCSLFQGSFLIMGIGSPLRSDDQAGLIVCEELSKKGIECIKCEYGLENCIGTVYEKKPSKLVIIDAALFENGTPGDVVIVDEDALVEGRIVISTHSIPLNLLLNMLKNEGIIEKAYIVGIYPENLDLGVNVSSSIYEAVSRVVGEILHCLDSK